MSARGAERPDARPVIGITPSEIRTAETLRPIKEGDPPSREIALPTEYAAAVSDAGGIPVLLPPVDPERARGALDHLDGICVSGGPDLDPAAYGEEPSPHLGPTDSGLDRFELDLVGESLDRDLPLLAVCRGMQILNVVAGGNLIQHLPEVTATPHRQDEPGTAPGHPVEIDPDSRLARFVGGTTIGVNTFHHQAIDRLGQDLEVVATAPDGVIEAVELPGRDFVVGVQWHAELAGPRPLETGLFEALVEAAAHPARDPGTVR
jgi:putative glutamine amidotransferase